MEERPCVDTRRREPRDRETPRRIHEVVVRFTLVCTICRGKHRIQECPTFQMGDLIKKNELVREHKLVVVSVRINGCKELKFKKVTVHRVYRENMVIVAFCR